MITADDIRHIRLETDGTGWPRYQSWLREMLKTLDEISEISIRALIEEIDPDEALRRIAALALGTTGLPSDGIPTPKSPDETGPTRVIVS